VKQMPSMDTWLREAKNHPDAHKVGIYLTHNGVVRRSARALVRQGVTNAPAVKAMRFSYRPDLLEDIIATALTREGIYFVRVWLNEGTLQVGDALMCILVGGDIRHRTLDCLDYLVGRIKNECVTEEEIYE